MACSWTAAESASRAAQTNNDNFANRVFLTGIDVTVEGNGIAVNSGDEILVQLAGIHWQGGTRGGPFSLHLFLDVDRPTSSNDAFANPLRIDVGRYHFDASLTGATNEPGESLPSPNAEQTLWWKFEAPENGVLNILLAASQFVPSHAVYEGTELASFLLGEKVLDSFCLAPGRP